MLKEQFFNIIFSIILLPANFCCAFWLFREALNLTGMTFNEFIKNTNLKIIISRHHRLKRLQRLLADFFNENSTNPQKSIYLTKIFGFSQLLGLAALCLAVYSAMNINNLKYAFIGNLILAAINITLIICGKIYKNKNPLDDITVEKLRVQKECNEKTQTKNIVIYSIIVTFLLCILLFFMIGISRIFRSHQYQNVQQSAISIQAELITILGEKGYETANVPTTYWQIDENKLEHVATGVKGKSRFEFYGYSDNETVDLVYNQIVYFTADGMESSEREKHETSLPEGNKMFTAVIDGIYYLVMYHGDTVIYAYSPDSLNEINKILTEIGYLKNS